MEEYNNIIFLNIIIEDADKMENIYGVFLVCILVVFSQYLQASHSIIPTSMQKNNL